MKKFNLFLAILLSCIAVFCSCGPVEIGDSSIKPATTRAVLINDNGDSVALLDDSSSIVVDESSLAETTTTTTTKSTTKKTTTTKKKTTTTKAATTTLATYQTEIERGAAPAVEETIIYEQTEPPAQIEEFIVFKSSTHYVHRSTCHWATSDCEKITDTENIKARKCTECNPNIEIKHVYKEPVTTTTVTSALTSSTTAIDSYSRQLLAEIVWHEAGSNWISTYEKAHIAAAVMNRVYDSRFPSTVYGVLTAPGQFTGYWPGSCSATQACYDAVDYYFSHTGEFDNSNSWYGDGRRNYFYYQ